MMGAPVLMTNLEPNVSEIGNRIKRDRPVYGGNPFRPTKARKGKKGSKTTQSNRNASTNVDQQGQRNNSGTTSVR